jgi:HEAT repeat protein
VRVNAIDALRNAGPRAREAVPRLRQALHDGDRAVRQDAARTLEKLDGGGEESDDRPPSTHLRGAP